MPPSESSSSTVIGTPGQTREQQLKEQFHQLDEKVRQECDRRWQQFVQDHSDSPIDEERFAEERQRIEQEVRDAHAAEFETLEVVWRELQEQLQAYGEDTTDSDGSSTPISRGLIPIPSLQRNTPKDDRHREVGGAEAVRRRGSKTKLRQQNGLLIVQHIEDLEALMRAELLAVCTGVDEPSSEQIDQIVELATEYAGARVQTLFPLDEVGRQAMWNLVQRLLPEVFVKIPVTSKTENGSFRGLSPKDCSEKQLQRLKALL